MRFWEQLKRSFPSWMRPRSVQIGDSSWAEYPDLKDPFEKIPYGLAYHQIICSPEGRPIDYRFLSVNKTYEEITGLKAVDIIGKTVREILPGIEVLWIDRFGQVALTGQSDVIEEFTAPLGKWRACGVFSARKGFFFVAVEDITERKKAEEALRQANLRLASIAEMSLDTIYRLDDRGCFSYVSPAVEALLGYVPEDVLGKPFQSFVFSGDLSLVLDVYQKVEDGRSVKGVQFRMLRRDAATVFVDINVVPLFVDGKFAGQQGVARDITTRRKAEEALRVKTEELEQERTNLQMIFSSVEVGMLLVDRDGVVRRVNEAATVVFKKSEHDLLGCSLGQALCCIHLIEEVGVCGNMEPCAECPMRRVLETVFKTGCVLPSTEIIRDFVIKGETRRVCLEVSVAPVMIDSTCQVILSLVDITLRKQAEQAIRLSEEKIRDFLNAVPVPMYLRNMGSVFEYCNDKFIAFFGTSHDRVVGHSTTSVFSSDVVERLAHFDEELWQKKGHQIFEMELVRADGKKRTVIFYRTLSYDADGRVSGFIGAILDITERQQAVTALKERDDRLQQMFSDLEQAHNTLKRTHEQMIQSEKMAAVGMLAAGIAHEINNPLGFIASNLVVLEKYVENLTIYCQTYDGLCAALDAKDEARISAARAEVENIQERLELNDMMNDLSPVVLETREGFERIRKIVQDLKSFSRADTGQMESVDINVLAESVLRIVWNEIKYKAEMVKEYGQILPITANPRQMEQVILNVLVNAAQAIAGHGVITIRTFLRERTVVLEIEDTGKGIPIEALPRIFDPFFTTQEPGEGMGMGLSISYDIVRRHHGTIDVESLVDKGTKVTIVLPVPTAS
jgi:PAS domain S-box-containing protein